MIIPTHSGKDSPPIPLTNAERLKHWLELLKLHTQTARHHEPDSSPSTH